jgi:hypothetical protein
MDHIVTERSGSVLRVELNRLRGRLRSAVSEQIVLAIAGDTAEAQR